MSPWQVLVVLIVLAWWGVSIAAGYLLGQRKGRTAAGLWLTIILSFGGLAILAFWPRAGPASEAVEPPADEPLTAVGSIQPQWEATLAQTDSWIWR